MCVHVCVCVFVYEMFEGCLDLVVLLNCVNSFFLK